jgi:DNA-binding IclR family transcriptional regulator
MAFAEAFQYLAKNPLPVRVRQVFDYLFGVLDMNNYLHIKQSDIAAELGLDKSDVSRAIKHLVTIGFLDPGPKGGRTTTYRMNAQVAWRGKAGARRAALTEASKRWGITKP